jgi:ribosomal protein L3 glutamine methyltransferase
MDHQQEALEQLVTVRDFLRWGVSRFNDHGLWYGHGTDNAWDEALLLVMHALHLPPEGDARFLDARLTTMEKRDVLRYLERRITERVPAAYLTGRAWFAGLEFHVDERVLIPRSPFAELIEKGLEPWLADAPSTILDLCCGSGCIGIACAYAFPDARVDLSDISGEALAVAEENIALHGVGDRVRALQSDLFAGLAGERYDVIISNPPYVDEADLRAMPAEYHHEPALALASGGDGLDFTRRLLVEAAEFLTDQGVLMVEVGNSASALEAAFPDIPFTWAAFEHGGDGIFILTRDELVAHRESFVK